MNNFKHKDSIGVEGMTSLVLRTDSSYKNCGRPAGDRLLTNQFLQT
jgi:hypothetical protein